MLPLHCWLELPVDRPPLAPQHLQDYVTQRLQQMPGVQLDAPQGAFYVMPEARLRAVCCGLCAAAVAAAGVYAWHQFGCWAVSPL